MDYFKKFPTINYLPADGMDAVVLRDITKRVQFVSKLRSNPYTFLPYTIEHGLGPEDVAYYYYGNARYVWLVYLSNRIKDPYYEWPLDDNILNEVIANKYQEKAQRWWSENRAEPKPIGNIVVRWTMRTDITENIAYFRKKDNIEETINKETYFILADPQKAWLDPEFDATEWEPLRYFDLEREKNESRRNIQLVNVDYKDQVEEELETLLNNG